MSGLRSAAAAPFVSFRVLPRLLTMPRSSTGEEAGAVPRLQPVEADKQLRDSEEHLKNSILRKAEMMESSALADHFSVVLNQRTRTRPTQVVFVLRSAASRSPFVRYPGEGAL